MNQGWEGCGQGINGTQHDAQGLPVFCFSSMSGHTKDLNAGNTQAALTVTAKGFEGAADGRVTLIGDAAHPMTPFRAQGANQALSDAVLLADALVEGIAAHGAKAECVETKV